MAIFVFEIVYLKIFHRFFYKICKEKVNEELRCQKANKACSNFFKFSFYIFDTSYCFYYLTQYNLIPWFVGGTALTPADQFQDLFLQVPNSHLRFYYSVQLAYHFNSVVQTLLGNLKKESFIEMATHHIICLMLFSMNLLTNRLVPTVALILCCSITDILMSLTRVLIDTQYNKVFSFLTIPPIILPKPSASPLRPLPPKPHSPLSSAESWLSWCSFPAGPTSAF
jgi:hypothetical protein